MTMRIHSVSTHVQTRLASARLLCCAGMLSGAVALPGQAINIVLDYTYDTQNFFGAGNPDGSAAGAQAKSALEAAATFFTDLLEDSFTSITAPPTYYSQVFNGSVDWQWNRSVTHPGTGGSLSTTGAIAADEYLIYAGGRSLGGTTLGQGGPGGFSWNSGGNGGGFTSQEIGEINAITDAFSSDVETRGQGAGFSSWGGAITFDNDGSADWHYDHTTDPTGNDDDFYSVALHELGHALGLGTSAQWNTLLSGGTFTGTEAVARYGGPVPADTGHWDEDVQSVVLGTTTTQEAAMDPNITNGTRKLWTDLDAAALIDIGWELTFPTLVQIAGDYNASGQVEQGDLDLVLQNWGSDTDTAGVPAGWTNDLPSGQIEQTELDGVLSNWGSTSAYFTGSQVPEPAMAGLLAGVLTVISRRPNPASALPKPRPKDR